ncbi:MAG: c-type cytochrome, partial [Candidatus Acidiferrales bacterium]
RYHARPTDDRGVLLAIARAPQKTRARVNPYEGQPDAVLAGQKLFAQHCAECHGSNARGQGRAMNLHLSAVQNATPGELEWFLRNGNLWRGMPSWSGLPEQRRWQIVAYLKSLRH